MTDTKRELTPAERLAAHKTVEEVPCITLAEAAETYNLDYATIDDAQVKHWNSLSDDKIAELNRRSDEELADYSSLETQDAECLAKLTDDVRHDRQLYQALPDDQKVTWRKNNAKKYSKNKRCPTQNILWIDTEKTRVIFNFRQPYGYVWDLTATYAQGKAIELDYKEFRLDLEPTRLIRRTRTTGLSGLLPKIWYKYTDEDLKFIQACFPMLTKKDANGKDKFAMTSEGWHYDRNEFYYEIKVNDDTKKDSEGRPMTLVITLSPDSLPTSDGSYKKDDPRIYWTLSHQTGFNENIAYSDWVFERDIEHINAKLIEQFDPESWTAIQVMHKATKASEEFSLHKLTNAIKGTDDADSNYVQEKLDVIKEKNDGKESALLKATANPLWDNNAMSNIFGFVSQNLAAATGSTTAPANKPAATKPSTMDTD